MAMDRWVRRCSVPRAPATLFLVTTVLLLAAVARPLPPLERPPTASRTLPASTNSPAPDIADVSIAGVGTEVDVGVPFTLTANVTSGLAPFGYRWSSPLFGGSTAANWTLTFSTLTATTIDLTMVDSTGSIAYSNLSLSAVTPPSLTLLDAPGPGDEGLPAALDMEVANGVAPYLVSWTLAPNGSSGSTEVSRPGSVVEPVWSNRSGPTWLSASVRDDAGAVATLSSGFDSFAPAPVVSVEDPLPPLEAGTPFAIQGLVVGGTPPVVWSLQTLAPVGPSGPRSGDVGPAGAVNWSATISAPGNFTATLSVVDAVGAEAASTFGLTVLPAVEAELAVGAASPTVGGSLPLSVLVAGGVGPYEYEFVASDGELCAGNLSSAGPVECSLTPSAPGYLLLSVTVRDGAGGVAMTSTTVLVGPVASSPSPGDPAGSAPVDWVVPVFGLVVVVGAVVLLLRRRRAKPGPTAAATTAVDPPSFEVVRRLIVESDGIDLDHLIMSADEDQVGRDDVESAVRAWTDRGRVRVENGPNGGRLFWVESPASAAPPAGSADSSGGRR